MRHLIVLAAGLSLLSLGGPAFAQLQGTGTAKVASPDKDSTAPLGEYFPHVYGAGLYNFTLSGGTANTTAFVEWYVYFTLDGEDWGDGIAPRSTGVSGNNVAPAPLDASGAWKYPDTARNETPVTYGKTGGKINAVHTFVANCTIKYGTSATGTLQTGTPGNDSKQWRTGPLAITGPVLPPPPPPAP